MDTPDGNRRLAERVDDGSSGLPVAPTKDFFSFLYLG
jgi:hypothetical protein